MDRTSSRPGRCSTPTGSWWPTRAGATRLGFALLLSSSSARFPRDRGELPATAVAFMAEQVGVPAGDLAGYDWTGRSIKYHRAEVREAFCFRESTVADEQRWARWLQDEVYPVELSEDRVRDALCGAAAAL
ncbi:MAG: DUF4158 domain-containing protein [Mycobacterium sp.]